MKKGWILFCALILTYVAVPLEAQQTGDPEKAGAAPSLLGSNAEGTHFIVGFMQNEENTSICGILGEHGLLRHRIAIASRFRTMVTLTYPNGTRIQRLIQPFNITSFVLDGEEYSCLGEGVCHKSFEIVSDEPISVYCFSSRTHSSDGYLALPTSSWGLEYFSSNYHLDKYSQDLLRDPDDCNSEPRGGEFAVIAAEDFTTVTVWPKARTEGGHAAGASTQQVLMKGEIWQIQDGGNVRGGSDITGSYVSADKPVGLLSGHVRTGIPWSMDTKDHIIEMLPPRNALGREHVVVPFGGRRGGDVVRVIASQPGSTAIIVTSGSSRVQYLINGPGSFQEMLVSNVTTIETDQPVLVTHYSQSNFVDIDSKFDPYMIVTTPIEQFVNTAVFQTMPDRDPNGRRQFEQHFVTLVVQKKNYTSVKLNGQTLPGPGALVASGSVPGLNDEYVWVTIRLPGGLPYTIEGNALFGGYVYGIGEFDSYGWPVGAGLFDVEIPDEQAPKLSATPQCGRQWYDVVITDSGKGDRGLSDVWLDRAASFNVDSLTDAPCVCGTNVYRMQVRLIDPDQPGRARIIARDNAGNLDTIELDLTAVKPLFNPDSILISKAEVGRLYQRDFTVTNPGTGEWIKFDSVRLKRGIEFKIVGLGSGDVINQYLVAGQSYGLTISFRADQNGAYEDTLFVYVDCRLYKIPLLATMAVPMIDTKDLDFGAVRLGKLKCLEIPVTNTGEARLRIDDVRIDGQSGIFIFDKNGVPADTFWLEPGESGVIIVCFDPEATVDYTGTVEFISNAAAGKSTSNLTGRGIYPSLTIPDYDFGEVQIGDTACAKIPIVNTGSDTAYLTGVTIPNGVFIEDPSVFPKALAPGDTLWVPVCFVPDEEGGSPFRSPIGADNSDGLEAAATLTGSTYQLLAEIDGYDWGQRWVGTRHDTIVHIRNLTGRPIRIDSIWIANGDEGDFAILTQIPPSIVLGPDEQYPVDVRFTPLLRGARSVGIYASTTSRLRPIIENVLEGFAIQALPGDELVHDASPLFSCDTRTSSVHIYNRGNAPLTINDIRLDRPSGFATLSAPPRGYMIPVGDDPLELEMHFSPNGYVGPITETVVWSFVELPGEEFSRTMTFESARQTYEISADAPPRVEIGEEFDLFVTVEDAFWKNLALNEVTLRISYNPTVAYFDAGRWKQMVANPQGTWAFTGQPDFPDSGIVRVALRPAAGVPTPIDETTFPAVPFRGFLGNRSRDTFSVALETGPPECVVPAATALPYSIAHICGLNLRLFEIAGEPAALREGRPNPASSTVEIDFTLPFDGSARLELFGLDGKRIRRILDGPVTAGDHTVTVDIRDLNNGVYYYRLDYGRFTASQPLLIRR